MSTASRGTLDAHSLIACRITLVGTADTHSLVTSRLTIARRFGVGLLASSPWMYPGIAVYPGVAVRQVRLADAFGDIIDEKVHRTAIIVAYGVEFCGGLLASCLWTYPGVAAQHVPPAPWNCVERRAPFPVTESKLKGR